MKLSDLTRTVVIDEHPTVVSIGEAVWWFPEAQLNAVPAVAFIKRFNDKDQVELSYVPAQGNRLVSMPGVRLIGDKLLQTNGSVRAQGCWCPRGLWTALKIDKPTENKA